MLFRGGRRCSFQSGMPRTLDGRFATCDPHFSKRAANGLIFDDKVNFRTSELMRLPCAQHGWRWCVHPGAGQTEVSTTAAMRVPRPGSESITSCPPMADRRSVILVSPHADRGGIEPSAGVADGQGDRLVVGVGRDRDRGTGPAEIGGILQGLAATVIQRCLSRSGIAAQAGRARCTGTGARAARVGRASAKPTADQQQGVDPVGEPADLGDRGVDEFGCLRQRRLISVAVGVAGKTDEDRQGDEVLLGAVVQVAFEAAPFFVGRGGQPGARGRNSAARSARPLGCPQRRGVVPHDRQR